ncbi:hypothetical protein KBY65_01010 [Cyanobium sp. Alchichica 3B3-8F6]|uniref:hypothetical protein n=1 Tax=unclassified Cyanobium TaxID=2627006 RepID=UPI0020CCFEAC|nr:MULTISPECIES: hypothetical protein [unclassified Cyanobium]MCP9881061.1 hypothetical protein [Cyanobium sp. Alchichica 3B3-8F6]MCP9941019.1 hypothetical protein [Cyanobium sp. ATX 6E8]
MEESQLEVQLVHADHGSRVVLVQARRGGTLVDGALGEAATAEEAEDRARQRLAARLTPKTPPAAAATPAPASATPSALPSNPTPSPPPHQEQPSPPAAQLAEEPPADPEDWSSELARLDLELQRLGWDRDQEAIYLERVFNHPNRNRLTSYGDLLAYLQALEGFAPGTDPATAPAPLRRRELLSQCDALLGQLQWDPGQGRAFLEQHFSLTSRQQLSDAQLLQFNMLLESEWLAGQNP